MRKVDLKFLVLAVIVIFLGGCQTTGSTNAVTSTGDAAPALCKVIAEPNPILIGEYTCVVTGTNSRGVHFSNPVSYRLEKLSNNSGYSLYYSFKPARGSSLVGYQDATINGNTMSFKAPSGRTIQFVAEGSTVYFVSPTSGEKFTMTRK
ncbi:hypothetical protein [Desulfoferrobacter suflitae]|uniref:hypothetical protein n=1 Tax=Desulfoferrobacter suflitae TaxID=2865782 RepID=UPI0021640362|nr:hypothetical protein [Desulfoferrobacter suflitae]MCK8604461.1 hypothetical protein [Desulfoferrobacter suflitae]